MKIEKCPFPMNAIKYHFLNEIDLSLSIGKETYSNFE